MSDTVNFGEVTFSAEQVTETHRTLEQDHTVTSVELPGMVNVYMHVGGGKILFTQYKAGKILDVISTADESDDSPKKS